MSDFAVGLSRQLCGLTIAKADFTNVLIALADKFSGHKG